jgi:hypothetical protein
MLQAVEKYQDGIKAQFNRLPVWVPGTPMNLGDIGVLEDGSWTKVSSLEEQGIYFEPETDPSSSTAQVTSGSNVETSAQATGETSTPLEGVASGHAGLGFRFASEGAFVAYLYDMRTDRIGDLSRVERAMLDRLGDGWKKNWVLVSEVTTAGPSLVLVAAGRDASASIDLGADLAPGGVDLGSADVKASIASSSNLAASFLSRDRTALLWKGRKVKGGIWTRPHVGAEEMDIAVNLEDDVVIIESPMSEVDSLSG